MKLLFIALSACIIVGCNNGAQDPIEAKSSSTPLTEKETTSPLLPSVESEESFIAFVGHDEQTTSIGLMTSDGQIEQIYVTNSDLTQLSEVTPENMRCNDPHWSPDSRQLVFACQGEEEENSDIWIVHHDGSNLQRLTDTPTYEGEPVWQPNP